MKKIKNLKLYATIGLAGLSSTVVFSHLGYSWGKMKATLEGQKEIIAIYDYQNKYLGEMNELLYQELSSLKKQEYQNLSVEGQNQLDATFYEIFQIKAKYYSEQVLMENDSKEVVYKK